MISAIYVKEMHHRFNFDELAVSAYLENDKNLKKEKNCVIFKTDINNLNICSLCNQITVNHDVLSCIFMHGDAISVNYIFVLTST